MWTTNKTYIKQQLSTEMLNFCSTSDLTGEERNIILSDILGIVKAEIDAMCDTEQIQTRFSNELGVLVRINTLAAQIYEDVALQIIRLARTTILDIEEFSKGSTMVQSQGSTPKLAGIKAQKIQDLVDAQSVATSLSSKLAATVNKVMNNGAFPTSEIVLNFYSSIIRPVNLF